MNRAEHLQWAKDRAVEIAKTGDLQGAFTSFQSDMSKHEELKDHIALRMFSHHFIGGHLGTPEKMIKFIQDFN